MRREAGRWFVSFACEVDKATRTPARPDATVGVDVGVSHLAVLSTGETIAHPRHLAAASRRLRRDGLHRLTSRLATTYGTVVVENLNVAGMVRNHRLAKAISDCGFGTIRQQLTYRTAWHGGRLVVADRWFPSSKTCSSPNS